MSDLYLMKTVIILKKMQDFRSIIFQPFQFEPEQKKMCGNESHEKETEHFTLQLPIYYMLEQVISIGASADIAKTKPEK